MLVLRVTVGLVFAVHGSQKLLEGLARTAGMFEALGLPCPRSRPRC